MFVLPAMAWQAGLRVTGWGSTNAIHRTAGPPLEIAHYYSSGVAIGRSLQSPISGTCHDVYNEAHEPMKGEAL